MNYWDVQRKATAVEDILNKMKWFKIIAWTVLVLGVASLGLFVTWIFAMSSLPF
ncbi:uncharacterized protein METZ01_LOCUS52578 [marine metagenome]|uniref:Uncharacterized protein n=1 Tax=marine metagenome TaxID=408172 RepID=A0A381S8B7_9ZZZZ